MNESERKDFYNYCQTLTDTQLIDVIEKEGQYEGADHEACAAIAREEARHRADKALSVEPIGRRNLDSQPLFVKHADLKRFSKTSAYRSVCPACGSGVLPMTRDSDTLELIRHDRCTECGQAFRYTDESVNGEPLCEIAAKLEKKTT